MTTKTGSAAAKKVPARKTATVSRRVASGSGAKKISGKAVRKAAGKAASKTASKTASKATPAASKARVEPPLKKDKPEKIKMVRDSYSMPEHDYAKLIGLKKKCIAAGVHVKKSELLRLGLLQLSKLGTEALLASAKRIAAAKKNKAAKA